MPARLADLGPYAHNVMIHLDCEGLRYREQALLGLGYWLVAAGVSLIVLISPHPHLWLIAQVDLIQSQAQHLADAHPGESQEAEKNCIPKADIRILEGVSRIVHRAHCHKSVDQVGLRRSEISVVSGLPLQPTGAMLSNGLCHPCHILGNLSRATVLRDNRCHELQVVGNRAQSIEVLLPANDRLQRGRRNFRLKEIDNTPPGIGVSIFRVGLSTHVELGKVAQ
ncbi:hypothetical protein EDC25_13315 [Pseudofulvimonas gallinarii]|uniref:Uncharacterized protein n=1 Tax=Pseudofulvimonas gallinarii TaxID=634155 RepID=A0A4V2UUR7_9GAMM|nr:hypothetical protein EDC25_13315 [Pseudofulvimonas gallinarii]